MGKPKIHVYAICRNEIEILPFFLSYYETVADKIVIFDNQSTDGSAELIQAHPLCNLVEFNTKNEMRDDILRLIKNSAWKDSKGQADWVIVSDIDEFLYHKTLVDRLVAYKAKGISIPKVEGFNMFSDSFPEKGIDLTMQVKLGAYSKQFSKYIVFDPNKIDEINYTVGGHAIEPEGNICYGGRLKLLHYKYLGPVERLQQRWDEMGKRLSQINIEKKWTTERQKPEVLLMRFEAVKKNAEMVVDPGFWEWIFKLKRIVKWRNKCMNF